MGGIGGILDCVHRHSEHVLRNSFKYSLFQTLYFPRRRMNLHWYLYHQDLVQEHN